jgi:hypothetical protein
MRSAPNDRRARDARERRLAAKKISAVATSRNDIFKEPKLGSVGLSRNLKIIDNGGDATYCCGSQFARPAIHTGFIEQKSICPKHVKSELRREL